MKFELKFLAAAFAVTFILSATASSVEAKTNCQNIYDRYLGAPGHKAFATSKGNDPGFHPTACSFIAGFSFKNLAEKKAVAECNQHSRPEDGGHCKVISSQ